MTELTPAESHCQTRKSLPELLTLGALPLMRCWLLRYTDSSATYTLFFLFFQQAHLDFGFLFLYWENNHAVFLYGRIHRKLYQHPDSGLPSL